MSQPFDDLYDQVQDLQNTSDTNQPTIDALTNQLQPDGTIRAQLDYPLDPQSVQEIQGALGTDSDSSDSEFNNGNVSGTATIDWSQGKVQYMTMTGNTTLTFINEDPGGRYLLHVAGAFTPSFPSNVRFPASFTPPATATAGKKDIYAFVYSAVEGLYDCVQSANFATS